MVCAYQEMPDHHAQTDQTHFTSYTIPKFNRKYMKILTSHLNICPALRCETPSYMDEAHIQRLRTSNVVKTWQCQSISYNHYGNLRTVFFFVLN